MRLACKIHRKTSVLTQNFAIFVGNFSRKNMKLSPQEIECVR
jgi:hypothetical protein